MRFFRKKLKTYLITGGFIIGGCLPVFGQQDKGSLKKISNEERYKHIFIGDSLPASFPKEENFPNSKEYRLYVQQYLTKNNSLVKPMYREAIKEDDDEAKME